MRKTIITMGRFNPFTRGHDLLVKKILKESKKIKVKPFIFIIDGEKTSKDKKRNPLSGDQRLSIIKSLYPDISIEVVENPIIGLDILEVLGYEPIIWYTGSDRSESYRKLLDYVGSSCKIKEINRFKGLGRGISATNAKNAVLNNDLESFASMIPKRLSNKKVVNVFEMIQKQIEK